MKAPTIIMFFMFISCKKSDCTTYLSAIQSGRVEQKTARLTFKDAMYELDYVRNQQYKDSIPFCYGHLELNETDFIKVLKSANLNYKFNDVYLVILGCEGINICAGAGINFKHAKYLLVYHANVKQEARLEYISLTNGSMESFPDSGGLSKIFIHLLIEKSKLKLLPSVIFLKNKDYDFSDIKFISKYSDSLYKSIND